MNVDYEGIAKKLRMIDMLPCDKLCACQMLKKFDISEPTLSHDMRKLHEVGLLTRRREGKNTYYSFVLRLRV